MLSTGTHWKIKVDIDNVHTKTIATMCGHINARGSMGS